MRVPLGQGALGEGLGRGVLFARPRTRAGAGCVWGRGRRLRGAYHRSAEAGCCRASCPQGLLPSEAPVCGALGRVRRARSRLF